MVAPTLRQCSLWLRCLLQRHGRALAASDSLQDLQRALQSVAECGDALQAWASVHGLVRAAKVPQATAGAGQVVSSVPGWSSTRIALPGC